MGNETQMPTAEEIGAATARAALYAASDEAARIIATFPPRLQEQAPSPEKATGEQRLAWAQRNSGMAARMNAAAQKAADENAANEARREEQRARNEMRADEAANYQAWKTSEASRGGKRYEPLHADCDLSVAQLAAWKVNAVAVSERKKALGFL